MANGETTWFGVAVVADGGVPHDEFVMPFFDADPAQSPEFRVTEETLETVAQSLGEYERILASLAEGWRLDKQRFMHAVGGGATPLTPCGPRA